MILIDTSVLEVPSGGFSWVVEQGKLLSCLKLMIQSNTTLWLAC
jgi:hypothetical protein